MLAQSMQRANRSVKEGVLDSNSDPNSGSNNLVRIEALKASMPSDWDQFEFWGFSCQSKLNAIMRHKLANLNLVQFQAIGLKGLLPRYRFDDKVNQDSTTH